MSLFRSLLATDIPLECDETVEKSSGNRNLIAYSISGNLSQTGTATPSTPLTVKGLGDKAVPNGYSRRTYIESRPDSTNYINSDIPIDYENHDYVWQFKINVSVPADYMGARGSFALMYENNAYKIEGSLVSYPYILNTDLEVEMRVINGVRSATINGQLQESTTCTDVDSIRLMGYDKPEGTSYLTNTAGKIYYSKLYKDGVLVQELVPVIRGISQVCMFDLVTQTYHTQYGFPGFQAGNPAPNYRITVVTTPESPYITRTTGLDLELPLYKLGNATDTISWNRGRNLFNKDSAIKGHLINLNTGAVVIDSDPDSWVSQWIEVKPNTVYYFKTAVNEDINIFEYTETKTYNNTSYLAENSTFVTSADCKYIRCHVSGTYGGAEMLAGETMLVEGSTAPFAYESYLRTPHIKREVGVKVFDGTETITSVFSVNFGYTMTCTGAFDSESTMTTNDCICTHFIKRTGSSANNNEFGVRYGTDAVFYLPKTTSWTSASAFKSWLAEQYEAETPVTVYYPLKTPQGSNIYNMQVPVFKGANTYSCNNELAPTDITTKAWCYRF